MCNLINTHTHTQRDFNKYTHTNTHTHTYSVYLEAVAPETGDGATGVHAGGAVQLLDTKILVGLPA